MQKPLISIIKKKTEELQFILSLLQSGADQTEEEIQEIRFEVLENLSKTNESKKIFSGAVLQEEEEIQEWKSILDEEIAKRKERSFEINSIWQSKVSKKRFKIIKSGKSKSYTLQAEGQDFTMNYFQSTLIKYFDFVSGGAVQSKKTDGAVKYKADDFAEPDLQFDCINSGVSRFYQNQAEGLIFQIIDETSSFFKKVFICSESNSSGVYLKDFETSHFFSWSQVLIFPTPETMSQKQKDEIK